MPPGVRRAGSRPCSSTSSPPPIAAAVLFAPASALASTASVENGAVVWRGTDAAETQIYVDSSYANPSVVRIAGPGVQAGAGCTAFADPGGDSGADCPQAGRLAAGGRGR